MDVLFVIFVGNYGEDFDSIIGKNCLVNMDFGDCLVVVVVF